MIRPMKASHESDRLHGRIMLDGSLNIAGRPTLGITGHYLAVPFQSSISEARAKAWAFQLSKFVYSIGSRLTAGCSPLAA